jgi:hypothetical protein
LVDAIFVKGKSRPQTAGGCEKELSAHKEETVKWRIAFVFAACAAVLLAQAPPETILVIESQNLVTYREDTPDQQRWATSAAPVAAAAVTNFTRHVLISDIVTVNGKPAKGTLYSQHQNIFLRPEPTEFIGIADISRNNVSYVQVEIQQADGTPVGSLVLGGPGGVSPALGAPNIGTVGIFAVFGGTGAFLGVRGQASTVSQTTRNASIVENPINRRTHPGAGTWKMVIHLIPMTRPEVLAVPAGPAIFHASDFSPVTAENPARVGEWLVMSATNLRPVRPNLDPGKPFPAWEPGKEYQVNSPVEVTVGGKAAELGNVIGWPAMNNVYRVDFRVPDGIAAGTATLGLSVAWINGPEVKFPVR